MELTCASQNLIRDAETSMKENWAKVAEQLASEANRAEARDVSLLPLNYTTEDNVVCRRANLIPFRRMWRMQSKVVLTLWRPKWLPKCRLTRYYLLFVSRVCAPNSDVYYRTRWSKRLSTSTISVPPCKMRTLPYQILKSCSNLPSIDQDWPFPRAGEMAMTEVYVTGLGAQSDWRPKGGVPHRKRGW